MVISGEDVISDGVSSRVSFADESDSGETSGELSESPEDSGGVSEIASELNSE